MELRIDLSAELREARERRLLSQVDLAALLGVAPRTVQNWEAGREPQMRHRRLIAAFLTETERDVA